MKLLAVIFAMTVSTLVLANDVVIYGKINQYVDSTRNGTGPTMTTMTSDTARLGFRGQEKLGPDLRVNFVIESTIFSNDPTTTDTRLGDRQSTLGLANSWGALDLGRKPHALWTAQSRNDPFAWTIASVGKTVNNNRGSRFSNGIFTNTRIENVEVSYDYGLGDSTGANSASSYSVALDVRPVVVTYARWSQGPESTDFVAARMPIGDLTLFANASDNRGATPTKSALIGATYRLTGAVSLRTTYGQVQHGVHAWNIGGEYAFSKRTSIQTALRLVDGTTTAGDIRQVVLGLQHWF